MYKSEQATKDDIENIFNLLKQNIENYEDLDTINYCKVLKLVYNNLVSDYFKYCRIIYDNIIVGYFSFIKYSDSFELNGLYIDEQHQNLGIGTSLLKEFVQKSEQLNMPIMLYVFSKNTIAINLYQNFGFNIIETHHSRFKMSRFPNKIG